MLLAGVADGELFCFQSDYGILRQFSGKLASTGLKRFFSLPQNLPHLKSSLGSVVIRAFSALAVGKWIAVSFGPVGTALFGQLMNLYTAFANMPNDGLARAMIKEGAQLENSPHSHSGRTVVATAFALLAALFALQWSISTGIAFSTSWFEPFQSSGWLIWFLGGFGVLSLSYFLSSVFLVWKKTNLQALASSCLSFGGLVGLGLTWAFGGGIQACLLGFVLGQAAGGFLIFFPYRNQLPLQGTGFSFDATLARTMLGFMLAVAGTGLLNQIGIYALVHWALEEMGGRSVGLWMAMGRFADAFNTPILAVSNSILLPMLAGHAGNKEELRNIIRPIFQKSLAFLALGMGVLFLAYPYLLPILFSKEFVAETSWIGWQILGDFFKSSTFVISILFLALGHTRFYFWLETGSMVLLLGLSYGLYKWMGFEGMFLTHAIRYLVYWSVIVWRYKHLFF